MIRPRFVLCCLLVFGAPSSAATQAPAPIDAAAWRGDLQMIATQIPQRHPNAWYRMPRASWDSAVSAIDRRLPNMTRNQAMVALMELVALVTDGHTSINPWFDPAMRVRYYPVDLALFEDGLFVRSASSEYAKLSGAKIIRIGRATVHEALVAVARVIPHENEWWARSWAPAYLGLAEILDGLGLVDDMERLPLVVERDGRQETVVVRPSGRLEPSGHNPLAAIDHTGWVDMSGSAPVPLWRKNPGRPYWMEYVAAERLLYVSYRGVISMDHPETNEQFWARVFAVADSVRPDRLVLDLRENIGGNSLYNRRVVRGIVARPAIDRPDRLFVITGTRTFSAAMNLVLDLERWTNATFVGEPTGNATVFFGDHTPITLPGSGFTVNVSSLPWYPEDPRDTRPFVAPRMYTPASSADYRANLDPALRAILAAGSQPGLASAMREAVLKGDTASAEGMLTTAQRETVNRFRTFESDVNALGYDLLRANRPDAAIAVFRMNTRAYPRSANAWDSLGEALLAAGQREGGIAAYRRALEIDPNFPPSREALERLGVIR